jgi:uncharacterized protein YgiM (DUF1202 family)
VVANLKFVRSKTTDRIETERQGRLITLVGGLLDSATPDEAAALLLALWVILNAAVIGAILWSQRRRALLYLAMGIAILLVTGAVSSGLSVLDEVRTPSAVVVADEIVVRTGPGSDYLTEFTLHSGAEVRVVERRGDWARVTLPGDLQGWAPAVAVIEVWPRN